MVSTITINTIYNCSLERAFKTGFLGDVSKVHTGYGLIPKVTHCTEDENWGKPGYSKKVFGLSKLFTAPIKNKVLERIENKYWKIEVSNFNYLMLGFSKFVGEWRTKELETNKILIEYTYTLHSEIVLLYPLYWLFAKIFFRKYMKNVLENVREMIQNNEPYLYN